MPLNLWHEIDRGTLEELSVIIEIPKGSQNKYEIDKKTGLIALDRANYSSAAYPFDYGFIPQTLWDDGDPLDVVLLTTFPLAPGILVRVRPVAMMTMTDNGYSDAKIIAVPVEDKRWENTKDLEDLNSHTPKEFQHFFETYKALTEGENPVTVQGWSDKKSALEAVQRSIELYEEKFGKK